MRSKASREEMEALLAGHTQQLSATLSAKADMEAVAAALAGKASRAELLEIADARAAETREEAQRLVAERATRGELAAQGGEFERRLAELHSELGGTRLGLPALSESIDG